MRIGVISDTHDFLDPKVPILFAGVEHVLHAGDIGGHLVLLELEQIAPVTAVGGNTDDPGYHYRETQAVELAGRRFLFNVDALKEKDTFDSGGQRRDPEIS